MLWPPRILTFLPGTRCINIQWCIKHQNFSMFIIVLEQHVSILIESSSGPSNDDSVRIETCCPNTIINTIKFCCVWLIHHCIFIYVLNTSGWQTLKVTELLYRLWTGQQHWSSYSKRYGEAVPLQAWTGPQVSRNLMFSDFVTTTQYGGRLSALRTGRHTSRKYSWY